MILNSDHRLKVGPDKIYIQSRAIDYWLLRQNIVYTKRLSDTSIEYLRKDALLEFLAGLEKDSARNAGTDDLACAAHDMVCLIIDKIESL